MNKIYSDPIELRLAIRNGEFKNSTAGQTPGYIQTNLMILPKTQAMDFMLFAHRNPKSCPLIEVLNPGAVEPKCAPNANIATDVPGYRVYRNGKMTEELEEITSIWQPDFVSFLIGCSFSFESALINAGIELRHVSEGRNVSMYRTNIPCAPAGIFDGEMVVSMRPIKSRDVSQVVQICERFTFAHGAPIHIGNPKAIGIVDLQHPDYGDPVTIKEDELPVFWACGVTPQWVAQRSRIPFCITHAPGKMFITDSKG